MTTDRREFIKLLSTLPLAAGAVMTGCKSGGDANGTGSLADPAKAPDAPVPASAPPKPTPYTSPEDRARHSAPRNAYKHAQRKPFAMKRKAH